MHSVICLVYTYNYNVFVLTLGQMQYLGNRQYHVHRISLNGILVILFSSKWVSLVPKFR